jgi:hypothetical protein
MSLLMQPDPNKIVDLPVSQLQLDVENPRLAWRLDGDSQDSLAKILWTEMAVDEVAWSIAENGFFRSEPLFVIISNPEEIDPTKRIYTVIEGNRRLTAVLLLTNEKLKKKVGATDLPIIKDDIRTGLRTLPAIIYESRESLWTTIGFRHINGIKPWDSFSKAKYIAEVHENIGVPLQEIAQRIGDRNVTVARLYRGYKVLEQAESEGVFNREDRARNRFYFSHLYTALDYAEFQSFLGLDVKTSLMSNPVPQSRLRELEELMLWLYGKKSAGINPLIQTQNPDLNLLRRVVTKPDALSVLRRTNRLERAYEVAIGDKARFRDALFNAKSELQNAKAAVSTGFVGEEDLYDVISDITVYAGTIRSEMETIMKNAVRTDASKQTSTWRS